MIVEREVVRLGLVLEGLSRLLTFMKVRPPSSLYLFS